MEAKIGISCSEERVNRSFAVLYYGNKRGETASQMHSIAINVLWKREREQPK